MTTSVMNTSWLGEHRDEIVVVKFGGNAMVDDDLWAAFSEDVVALRQAGISIVVTHGGGPQISAALAGRGIANEFRGGLRYTSPEAVLVVKEVLVTLGRDLVAGIGAAGGAAVAITGDERHLFSAAQRGTVLDGTSVDLGRVGEVVAVDPAAVVEALDAGTIPVVSVIAPDITGAGLLNVNADSAAAELAVALRADWLVILSDVPGLYRNWPDRDSLVRMIDSEELAEMIPRLESGMIPKMGACLTAVTNGVGHASIIDGRVPHALLREPFGASGTSVVEAGKARS